MTPSVLKSRVTHARRTPVANSFSYGVDYLLLSEAQLNGSGATPGLLSIGARNLVSLRKGDHGPEGTGGTAWVRRIAAEAGLSEIADITLLTHPRYWGYAFNPVSFWLMTDPDGDLIAVLAEVHNTFGQRHCYLCQAPDGGAISPDRWIDADKNFHVSPFFGIEGSYRFRFALKGDQIGIWIRYDDGKGGGLFTSLIGKPRPLTNGALASALIRRPLGSLKVMALIHWQALKLFLKGIRYRRCPEDAPEEFVT